jgi:hypothetical protein
MKDYCFFFAIVLLVVLVCPITYTKASIQVPEKAGEYSKEFFEAHRKTAAVYDILVDLFSQSMIDSINKDDGNIPNLRDMSVMDVGCGHGLLVEAWRKAGVTNSYCIEGSPEAEHMWPQEYKEKFYVLQDLEAPETRDVVTATNFVTSFEVGEHLQPENAGHFVEILTLHHPRLVFFGAATPFQDRGMNPSHVNENTFEYWIKHFAFNGYHVDWTRTAMLKHKLLSMHSKEFIETVMKSWWYPKNLLVFAPKEARSQDDQALMMHPKQANMLNKDYLERVNDLFGDGEFGKMWKDDWQSFGTLFYAAKLNVNAAQESLTTKTPEL